MALRWTKPIDTTGIAVVDHALQRAFLGVTLPSEESANALMDQKPGAFWEVLLHFLGRTFILGTGLAAAGARGMDLVKYSLAGGAVIEASVLSFAWTNRGSVPLPSGQIAEDLLNRKPGAFFRLVLSFLTRALEIGVGVALAGLREPKTIVTYSLAGSAAVEAFVQTFALLNRK
jgi:hypothetical protein